MTQNIKTAKDIYNAALEMPIDPNIEEYYIDLVKEMKSIKMTALFNQFYNYYDFSKMEMVCEDNNIYKILGYTKEEFYHLILYENIHPADRLLIYKATKKVLNIIKELGKCNTKEITFLMDFRIRKKDGDYIRVLKQTGCLVSDRLGNMIFSYDFYTDITEIKRSNIIKFSYKGSLNNINFPDDELLEKSDALSLRELSILKLLAKSMSSKEIAEILFITKNTVDTHRRKMLKKTMLKNTSELIVYGLEIGII